MSAFINNPKLAPEPLTEIYHVDAHEGVYSGTRVATVYKRHPQEHFPEHCVGFRVPRCHRAPRGPRRRGQVEPLLPVLRRR